MNPLERLIPDEPQREGGADSNEPIILATLVDDPSGNHPPLPSGSASIWNDSGLAALKQAFGSEAYGAPRVFDLFTLMAITLAFALLFGGFKLFEPALGNDTALATSAVSAFVTGIAIAQLSLWGGNLPRLASIVGGPIVWCVVIAGVSFFQGARLLTAVLGGLCSAPFGLFAGYLGGAIVAGVFLIADSFRTTFMSSDEAANGSESRSFDEVD